MPRASQIQRLPRRVDACRVPQAVAGEPGRFIVDATWGTINPMCLAPGVRPVGELELIAHIDSGLPLIDTRWPETFADCTIPGASNLPHADIERHPESIDRSLDTILFCNGPQCSATPRAIRALLEAGHPPERVLYYRGGMHDWLTLGLPCTPRAAAATSPTRVDRAS